MFEAWFVDTENRAYVDGKCVAAEGSHAACWSISTLYKYVETPLFVAENRFDQEQVARRRRLCATCPPCAAPTRVASALLCAVCGS